MDDPTKKLSAFNAIESLISEIEMLRDDSNKNNLKHFWIAKEENNPLIHDLLSYRDNIEFLNEDCKNLLKQFIPLLHYLKQWEQHHQNTWEKHMGPRSK